MARSRRAAAILGRRRRLSWVSWGCNLPVRRLLSNALQPVSPSWAGVLHSYSQGPDKPACNQRGVTLAFDQAYYQKFYFDPRTAVTTQAEMKARAQLIIAYAGHVGLPVRRILDAGCGTGMLRKPLEKAFSKARYTGLDVSEYLCERFGWEHGTVDTWSSPSAFDLVVCYDVVQYLDDRRAAKAVTNLSKLCRAVLYFGALTATDWRQNCDRRRTDADVYMRTGKWYRTRLRRYFHEIGAGFWLRRGAPINVWELETAG